MPTEDDLPSFIRRHIGSVWALEILLLLRREPGRAWTITDIVLELRASSTLVTNNLAKFEQSGLVIAEPGELYIYQPASPLLDSLCGAVEAAYRERPVAMINLISAPEERLQQLANAFRIGRGRP